MAGHEFFRAGDAEADEKKQRRNHQDKLVEIFKDAMRTGTVAKNAGEIIRNEAKPADQLDRDYVAACLANNVIDEDLQKSLISRMKTPVDVKGAEEVFKGVSDKHEKRIIAYFSGPGFSEYEKLSQDDFDAFIDKFKSPYDFADEMSKLVEQVRKYNGDQKAEEYEEAGKALMKKVFGKKYEYWRDLEALKKDSPSVWGMMERVNEAKAACNSDEERQKIESKYDMGALLLAQMRGIGGQAMKVNRANTKEAIGQPRKPEEQNKPEERPTPEAEDSQEKLKMKNKLISILSYIGKDGFFIHEVETELNQDSARDVYRDDYKRVIEMIKNGTLESWEENRIINAIEDSEDEFVNGLSEAERSFIENSHNLFPGYKTLDTKDRASILFSVQYGQSLQEAEKHLLETLHDKGFHDDEMVLGMFRRRFSNRYFVLEQLNNLKNELKNMSESDLDNIPVRDREAEPIGEWRMGDAAYCVLSKSSDHESEDCCACVPEIGAFGVFDGVGNSEDPRGASSFASNYFTEECKKRDIKDARDLADVLYDATDEMIASGVKGATTAVCCKIIERDDGPYLAYVNMGDSRLYVVHANGETEQITSDEGKGNKVSNCLDAERPDFRPKQFGEIKLRKGDKLLLCSDGITGDQGRDQMSPREIGNIMMGANSAKEASDNFVSAARKFDDKTAIVIGEF